MSITDDYKNLIINNHPDSTVTLIAGADGHDGDDHNYSYVYAVEGDSSYYLALDSTSEGEGKLSYNDLISFTSQEELISTLEEFAATTGVPSIERNLNELLDIVDG